MSYFNVSHISARLFMKIGPFVLLSFKQCFFLKIYAYVAFTSFVIIFLLNIDITFFLLKKFPKET